MIKRKRKRNPLDEITRIQLVKYLADAEKNGSYSSLKHALFILENNGDLCKNCSNLYGEDLCDCYTCPRDYDEYEEPCEDIDFCVCDLFDGQPKKKEIKEHANELINGVLTEEEIYRIVVLGNDDLQFDLKVAIEYYIYYNEFSYTIKENCYYNVFGKRYGFFRTDVKKIIDETLPYVQNSGSSHFLITTDFPLNLILNFYLKYLSINVFNVLMKEILERYTIAKPSWRKSKNTPITKQFIEFFLPYVEDDQLRSDLKNFFLKKQNPHAKKKPRLNSKKNTKLKISSRSNKNRL